MTSTPQRPAVSIDCTVVTGSFSVTARFDASDSITALFGPSGSGKTVTLSTIAGLLRPERGTIALRGRTVADSDHGVHVPTQDRRVGMVFQHAALLPHRSPLDNVALGVRGGDRRSRRQGAQRWLERVHAGHLARSTTSALSGGEQQRIALARALAGEPDLLLLDEPFTALDLPTRTALRDLVRALVDDGGPAVVIVTHDLDDVTSLADQVVLFEPGRSTTTHSLTPGDPAPFIELIGHRPG